MGKPATSLIAFLSILVITCNTPGSNCYSNNHHCTCKQHERKALLDFKHSLIDGSNRLASWVDGEDCCSSWEGVECTHQGQRTCNVVALRLGITNCTEQDVLILRNCKTSLKGKELSRALFELKHLRHLDLSGNDFSQSRIPQFIGSLEHLRYLNLSFGNFGGQIPHQIGNLTHLRSLDLSNSLYLQDNSLKWVSGLRKLKSIDLSWVNLGQAPYDSLQVFHQLPSLQHLRCSDCELRAQFSLLFANSTFVSTSSLRLLNLEANHLDGPLPHSLANLSHLAFLDLSDNHFSSSIPIWLAGKRSLYHLRLAGNSFTSVEDGILGFLGQSCHLKYLDFSGNHNLGEVLVESSSSNVFRCAKYNLISLYMRFTNISGSLDWLENFKALQNLDLSLNSFVGSFPTSVTTLSSLELLHLQNNSFSGNIPSILGEMQSLKDLDLSRNNLSGVVSIDIFANLSNLRSLALGKNSLSLELEYDENNRTSFPKWLLSKKFTTLDLSKCNISLRLPQIDEIWPSLVSFNLADNQIHGSLSQSLSRIPSSLVLLCLSNNHISGFLPNSLCSLPSLQTLDLQNNIISGEIPGCLGNNRGLGVIDLSSNKLSGLIPSSLWTISKLYMLHLSNNSLRGELPMVNVSTELELLDLSDNKLSRNIPPWTEKQFGSLMVMRLRNNFLTGLIPRQMCTLNQSLQLIDLANNHLTGAIPSCFGNLHAMKSTVRFDFSFEDFSMSIEEVMKGDVLKYSTNLKLVANLDLSCNYMTGAIPPELTNLAALKSLNLSNNHLTGTIPSVIGQMRSLESLDLSNNHLHGSIPQNITTLNFLEFLNLSYNNLSGMIPTGNQIQTLDNPSFYVGNPNLCAEFLPKKCASTNHGKKSSLDSKGEEEEEDGDDKHEKIWLYIFFGLGVGTGFWGVIGILIVKKRWRYAYFRFAERVGDWIYVRTALIMARWTRKIE